MTQPTDIRLLTEAKFNAGQSAQDGRLALLEGAAGFTAPPLGFQDEVVEALVADTGSQTYGALSGGFVTRGEVVMAQAPSGADDTAVLDTFLAGSAGKTVTLRPGATYKISDTIHLPSRTVLDLNGATIDATAIPAATTVGQRVAVLVAGTAGTELPVGTAIVRWGRVITGVSSTTGLAAGDMVLLSNNEVSAPGSIGTGRLKGDLAIIQSVDSATQVTLTAGVLFDYGTSGLKLQKITAAENIAVRNGSIKLGGVGSGHNAVQVKYGRNVAVTGVVIDGAEDMAVSFYTVWGGKAQNNTIRNSTSSTTLGNTGYGVAVLEGSRHVQVTDNQFYNCRHFVAGGGLWPPAFVDVKGNHGNKSSDAGYDCHESCYYWNFEGNTAHGVAMGFIVRGQYCTVAGNKVVDSTGTAYRINAFGGVTEQRGMRVVNNEATRCTSGVEMDGQGVNGEADCKKYNVEIIDNRLRDCGANPILIRNFDGAKIGGNFVSGATSHAILCLGLSTAQSVNLMMTGDLVQGAGADGVKIQYVDGVKVNGTEIVSPVAHGLEMLNCNRTNTVGLTVRSPGAAGINISAGAGHSITAPFITGNAATTYDAIRIVGSSDVAVSGGTLASGRWAVYSTTTDNVVVTGVHAKGAAQGARFSIDATNKVVANNLI